MEINIKRDTIRFERLAATAQEQVTIEGEATLPGSMRDAVTVLSVQAQAHLTGVQAAPDLIGVRGRVVFQVLYTQGDLTRIRVMETTCDFTHQLSAMGVTSGMRISAKIAVQETNGSAGSGRLSLSALLDIGAQAVEETEQTVVSSVEGGARLCAKQQTILCSMGALLGEGKTLVREEFDLPDRLQVLDVLAATGTATIADITGGNGSVGVSGVVEVRVLHRPSQPGEALVMTTHEVPFQLSIPAQLEEGSRPIARAEVVDVMADSTASDRQRTMRVEAEICVRLSNQRSLEIELLEDLYSTEGPLLEPQIQDIAVHTVKDYGDVRESVRIQATIPNDAPPIDTVLTAFAQPMLLSSMPAGRRMNTEGVMNLTLLYLPVDSDIPYAVKVREPFSMTFPLEVQEGADAQIFAIECSVGPATSDRVELRCVLGLHAEQNNTQRARIVTDILEKPEEKQEHGFMLVWPAPGETRWDTARRLRVPQENLRPAGSSALLAFRK